ncbi:MAG: 4Fe-4S dicluster domain-containing protein [Ignavibacteriae bacterium]|nr:4Fe-4S dicluster domain-containing protein [Ignavibacteriota bacterium]
MPSHDSSMFILQRTEFDRLLTALQQRGYCVLGPTVRDGAIAYDEVPSSDNFPVGWTDEQRNGAYRLKKRTDNALFGYVVGPYSWKKFLFPPVLKLFSAKRNGKSFDAQPTTHNSQLTKFAFIGVRSCELHALGIQDTIFTKGEYIDPHYQSLREQVFVIAVNCTEAGGTCFCVSMNTGPKASSGFDLALTEIINEKEHYFVVESGSEQGKEILKELSLPAADATSIKEASRRVQNAAQHMGKTMNTTNVKQLLQENFEHPRWDDTAKRCLTCANCTMVCPTCFCTTVEDVTDLTGEHAERWRKWDSCFTMDFSYIHGGSIRPSVKARYRQWMTHKLSTWFDQFGTSGCVGCGRCITWCPVGIDITEEVRAIQNNRIKEQLPVSV